MKGVLYMSDLQKEILNMVIIFNDDTLISIKPLFEKLLNDELLKFDPDAKVNEMTVYDKIDTLKAISSLNDDSPTISYSDALKDLGLDGDIF